MIIVVKCLIVLCLGLLPVSAWVYRKQLPSWLLVLYAAQFCSVYWAGRQFGDLFSV